MTSHRTSRAREPEGGDAAVALRHLAVAAGRRDDRLTGYLFIDAAAEPRVWRWQTRTPSLRRGHAA